MRLGDVADSVVFSLHTNMHACLFHPLVNHIHSDAVVSDATAPLFLVGFYVRVTGLDC